MLLFAFGASRDTMYQLPSSIFRKLDICRSRRACTLFNPELNIRDGTATEGNRLLITDICFKVPSYYEWLKNSQELQCRWLILSLRGYSELSNHSGRESGWRRMRKGSSSTSQQVSIFGVETNFIGSSDRCSISWLLP